MDPSKDEYGVIARWLDGERVELTDWERALGEEIRRDERDLGAMLDVSTPPEVLERVRRRMTGRRVPPRRRVIRIGATVGALTAAAALVLGITLLWNHPRATPPPPVEVAILDVDNARSESLGWEAEMEMLNLQLDELEVEIVVSARVDELGESLEFLEEEIEQFWSDPTLEG